jgi:hypothetical protein
VRRVDAKLLESAADVGVAATGERDSQVAQDTGDADGVRGRFGEQFAGVFLVVFGWHVLTLS